MPAKDELVTIVTSLNAFQTAVLNARLNTMYRHSIWSRHPQDAKSIERFQYWFAAAFLDLDTKVRLESRFGSENPARRPVFHPLQSLQVMKLALSLSEGDGTAAPDTSEFHRHQLAKAYLMVSDFFLTDEEEKSIKVGPFDARRKQLMLQSLASFEVANPTPLRNLLFRAYATYRIVLQDPRVRAAIWNECALDLEKEFESQFQISLIAWLSMVFGVQTALLMNTQDDLLNKPENFIVNRRMIFRESKLNQSQIDNFFDALSSSFEDLRSEVRRERPVDARFDVVPFKSKPFFVTAADNYACVDLAFVTEKLHNGPYFLLANRLPENQRGKVFKAWGILFEAYVNWLLSGLNNRRSAVFFPDTRWQGGEKSFDAVFLKNKLVVVLEYKGGFLRQDARYANDLEKFMADLQGKIGVGCRQLARDIGALFPAFGTGKRLAEVPIPTKTALVLPVLVLQDPMLRTPFINYFLNQRFEEERGQFPTTKKVRVLPLNVVQVTDLENLVEMAEAFNLDVFQLLRRRCELSPDMLLELSDLLASIPDKQLNRLSPRFKETYKKSEAEMCSILFRDYSPV